MVGCRGPVGVRSVPCRGRRTIYAGRVGRRRVVGLLVASSLLAVGCSDGDEPELSVEVRGAQETPSSTSQSPPTSTVAEATRTTVPEAVPTTGVRPPETTEATFEVPVRALSIDPPSGFEDLSADHGSAVLAALHGDVEPDRAVYVATGRSIEPAGVLDPNVSILGNQALAAGLTVVDELLGGATGDPEVVSSEATSVEDRPAWRVRFRILTANGVPAEVDLVGFEESGDFDFVVGVVEGVDTVSIASIGSIVDRARLTPPGP